MVIPTICNITHEKTYWGQIAKRIEKQNPTREVKDIFYCNQCHRLVYEDGTFVGLENCYSQKDIDAG